MADSVRVAQIDLQQLLPWTRIVFAVRIALTPAALVLATIAVFATFSGWSAIGYLYEESENPKVRDAAKELQVRPWWVGDDRSGPQNVIPSTAGVIPSPDDFRPTPSFSRWKPTGSTSPFLDVWEKLSSPFVAMFNAAQSAVGFSMYLLASLWALLVWSLLGSGITRLAALRLARGDQIGFRAALVHGIRRWPAYVTSVLIPLIATLCIAVLPAILGLLMRNDFFVMIGGILWPLVLMAATVMTILLLGLFFGWPLMWPTISVENTDPFDALSRAYSYTYQRPFRYLWYVIVATFFALLSFMVVWLFAKTVDELAFWSVSWGTGIERMEDIRNAMNDGTARSDWMRETGAMLIRFWIELVYLVAYAFLFSYFWSAMTVIYTLLRKDTDGTEPGEISLDPTDPVRGLPPLQTDAAGVPAVSDLTTDRPGPTV